MPGIWKYDIGVCLGFYMGRSRHYGPLLAIDKITAPNIYIYMYIYIYIWVPK